MGGDWGGGGGDVGMVGINCGGGVAEDRGGGWGGSQWMGL